MGKESKIGYVCDDFTTIKLKSVLLKNEAGDWGSNPDENAIGIIRSTNFNNNGILELTDVAYRTLSPKKKEEKKLYVGDILIERSGGSDTQPVGRVGLITEHMLNEDFAFANFIQRISVKKDILLPQYLYYCLQQMYEMGITASMQAQTTGIRNLDWKQYVKTILPKPSLSEQTAIAKILSTVDEAIRSTRETISKLERVKKSLMQNLLSGKMKPDGTLRPAAEFYEDEKMGLVPKGWKSVKLKEVGNIQTGKTPPTAQSNVFANSLSKGFMFITPGDLGDGKYITDSERYVTEKGIGYSYRLPKGSIAIVCIGSTIGKIGIVSTESCTNQQINAIIVNDMNNNEFLYYLMQYKTPHFKEIAGVNATPQINKSTFQKYRIILPIDKQEQCAIANKLSTIDSEINKKQEKITALESLKKSLMQQLLTGNVRVK